MSAAATPAALADPRPVIVAEGNRYVLHGGRCDACGHATALLLPRCPRCGSAVSPASHGPQGKIWAVTVIHVPPAEGEQVPYTLAYVDLDDGPRLLARVTGSASGAPAVGSRVTLAAPSPTGNPVVEVAA